MKKSIYETIKTALTNFGYDNQEVLDALDAELTKGQAQKEANAKAYEDVHDVIVSNLSETPATLAELWDATKPYLPEGFEKGKYQYALTHLWQDEIVKIEGKPNTYRKA